MERGERELFAMFTIHKIISLLRSYRILLKQPVLCTLFGGVCSCCAEPPRQYFNANALNIALDLLRVLQVCIVERGTYCS